MIRSFTRRLFVCCVGFALAAAGAVDAWTIYSPIAVIAEDAAVAALAHEALRGRFKNLVIRQTLAAAQEEARQEGGPEVALVVASSEDLVSIDAYGASLPSCHVRLVVQVLRLPTAELELTHSADGKGPDCSAAQAAASAALGDGLLTRLEEYRRHGTGGEAEEHLWLELADEWSTAEIAELHQSLRQIPGIKVPRQPPTGHRWQLAVYRQARVLAREIDRLAAVKVTRLSGQRVTLTRSRVTAASAPAAMPADAPRQPFAESVAAPRAAPSRPMAAPSPLARGRKWALVVGVSEFRDPAVPSLTYSVRDARALVTLLQDPAVGRFPRQNVVLLLDDEATTRRIKTELDHLAHKTVAADLFVFYISTHAVPGNYDVAGDAYLVTHDTEKLNLYATGLPMRELVDALSERIRAQAVVGFLDACNTGQIVERSGPRFTGVKDLRYDAPAAAAAFSWAREWQALSKQVAPPATLPDRPSGAKRIVFISSSDGDQPSWESEALGHGFFTYYLMEELRESKGKISISSLFDSLKYEVQRAVRAEKGALQEPRMFFNHDADFSIGYSID